MTTIPMTWLRRLSRGLLFAAVAVALGACSGDDEADNYVEGTVETLYNQALDNSIAGNYATAAALFDEVERQHPYSQWATRADLMSAHSWYQAQEYDQAIIALDRFIQLHPGNRNVDYAYFLRAMAYFKQIPDVRRDQTQAENALRSFDELARRFPNSRYAANARTKIDVVRDHLAGAEMDRGRYYLYRGQYLAAINRFRTVVDEYQTTSQVAEALYRLVESYASLGVQQEAQQAAAVLGYNFPSSVWYLDSYNLMTGSDIPEPGATEDSSFWSWLF